MMIFKTKSIIFKVDNEKISEDKVMMIEIELREFGCLSEETIKKYSIDLEYI